MKIVAISDTHMQHKLLQVPDGDLIIHSGDATNWGSPNEIIAFASWFGSLPHGHKVFVPGNHDIDIQNNEAMWRQHFKQMGITMTSNGVVFVGDLKLLCVSYVPVYGQWAFMRDEADLHRLYTIMPVQQGDIDILVTHGPPLGILDFVCGYDLDTGAPGWSLGSKALREFVHKIKPRAHVFGHIHEGAGEYAEDGTLFFNAAMCNRVASTMNKPLEFEL